MNISRRRLIAGSAAAAGALLTIPQIGRAQTKLIRVGLIPSEDSRAMIR